MEMRKAAAVMVLDDDTTKDEETIEFVTAMFEAAWEYMLDPPVQLMVVDVMVPNHTLKAVLDRSTLLEVMESAEVLLELLRYILDKALNHTHDTSDNDAPLKPIAVTAMLRADVLLSRAAENERAAPDESEPKLALSPPVATNTESIITTLVDETSPVIRRLFTAEVIVPHDVMEITLPDDMDVAARLAPLDTENDVLTPTMVVDETSAAITLFAAADSVAAVMLSDEPAIDDDTTMLPEPVPLPVRSVEEATEMARPTVVPTKFTL